MYRFFVEAVVISLSLLHLSGAFPDEVTVFDWAVEEKSKEWVITDEIFQSGPASSLGVSHIGSSV